MNSDSYCVLPWVGSAVSTEGKVVPCCRWMGPHGNMENAPDIDNGLVNARNSKFWQNIRQEMLEGTKPTGCKRCWEEEKVKGTTGGYRTYITELYKITTFENSPTKIRFLETGISSLCNFACIMCNAITSSTIHTVMRPKVKVPKGFHKSNENIDDDLSELQQLKILGGEPMLEIKHDEFLEKVISLNNNPSNLEIEYHTNASIFPSKQVINCWKKVKSVRIIFSLDGVLDKATLQRPGRYKWKDVEATVNKYVQLTNEVNIIFSSNTVLTALNIGQVTDVADWLYSKIGKQSLGWFHVNPINSERFPYIDFRNLSKETKDKIKTEWKQWESTNPPVLESKIATIYTKAKDVIDETGTLDYPLTKEIILEKHHMNNLWKHFKEDLGLLNI